ncbi:PP2C family protein-serine/threonine phosphatase [Phycisphaerales bacterium AB-hyl4]|uniref:PP2C family protein-serine/threonine phosphatase n=1 Tax=Natronomicrosphaera hydrolytica TaxID=3242702 RepID=A0ABV4U3S5_9BACT
MSLHPLLVINDDDAPLDEAALNTQIALETWPAADRPRVCVQKLTHVLAEPALLNDAAVVWCMLGQARDSEVYELVCEIQDRRTPMLLTREGDTRPTGTIHDTGVVVCPVGTDPTIAGVMLRSLWSQSPVLHELQAEVRLLRQTQGGLSGEIDKLDEELRLAAQLQREFMPSKLPDVAGMEFRVLWRPASYVSGDIYDVMRLDEHHMGFFVADAVGHGVPAALLTMFIKRSLHTKVIDPNLPAGYRLVEPSETMTQLNRDLLQHNRGQIRFTTACYGVIDNRTHTATIARGGHPYPLLLRAAGGTETIDPEGPLLGVFEDEPFEQVTVQLDPGDRLLLYSDGFEMAFPGEELVKTEGPAKSAANMQYTREFEQMRHGTIDEAMDLLARKLDRQAGSLNQRDDLTLMSLHVHELAAAEGECAVSNSVSQSRSRPHATATT